ncbi:NtaA/DmoA family FMN-dependent monooxygenase [Ancylobacter rudongensis]|uniref:FMN-dependent oxidoreductase, nitrilotriacetate monooxygenase family n=1 Tax=Ancylobacter rudongensis TaxID=177413 RepID=A0A1G4PCI6_9HYPH|nr:NtaA/DmoA family FMN-dependent monooxygenase [Ancylobacter rudongensis]SCW29865.1 FMN-dependent oxidoreductase, nitrilotriacetate monooxygenase family [Ancylobacter rudongensis]
MSPRPLHLGWFTNFAVDEWTRPFTGGGGDPWDGKFYIDMAQAMERACFDYIMLEDTLMISEAYGGTNEVYLKHNIMGPKADPSPMAALIGANTKNLGVVATFSTMAYPPFMLARLCSTLDSLCKGRFGWNIVTSGEDLAAENFGMDKLPPRQERYDMADEYVELCKQLWGSWDADAVVRDRATGTYADASKVRPIHFEGKYFKSRGPLNCVPSPQQRPAFVQAGGSPRGRQFAAMTADSIIAPSMGVAGLKAYRDDVRARAEAGGRDPDEIKVLFVVAPILGETEEEAKAKAARIIEAPDYCEKALALIAAITDIDFSTFDLDAPLPHLTTNGEQGSLDAFQQTGSGKTLRQLCADQLSRGLDGLIGTPDQVAERMGEVMAEVGGDGFLITRPFTANISRQYITDICEGLVPALQRRGLARTRYTEGATLRQLLREF